MQEAPKEKPESDEPDEVREERRSYYYDDAHGYEDFDPEADEDEQTDVQR